MAICPSGILLMCLVNLCFYGFFRVCDFVFDFGN
jgi:hypothetical protein